MINEQLLAYIRQQTSLGASKDAIVKTLTSAGWTPQDVAEGFAVLNTAPTILPPTSLPATPPVTTTMPSVPTEPAPIASPPPVVLPTPAPAVVSTSSPLGSNIARLSGKWLLALACVGILFVAAGGAAAYYVFFAAPPTPTAILKNAMAVYADPPSFSFVATTTGQVAVAPKGRPSLVADFNFVMQGLVDRQVADNPALDATFGGTLSTDTATDTGSAAFSLHSIYTNKKVYLELNNFHTSYTSKDPKEATAQLFVAVANGFASSFENKWIEVDASSTQMAVPSVSLFATSSPALDADTASLKAYINGMTYLASATTVGTENVQGVPVYHLALVLHYEQQLADLSLKYDADQQHLSIGAPAYIQLKNTLSGMVGKEVNVDVWVGKSDSRIYKMAMAPLAIDDQASNTHITISFESMYSDYNKNFTIVAPTNAEPLQQLIQSMFGGLMQMSSTTSTTKKTTK